MAKKISLVLMVGLYVLAGLNHFLRPSFYYQIIPPYLPWPAAINIVSGIAEIILGTMLVPSSTRKTAAFGVIILLVAFIPAHVYMIQKGGCMGEGICIPLWIVWLRLFPLQFLLIYWAWINRK